MEGTAAHKELESFSDVARQEFEGKLVEYGERLLQEAQRLEATNRGSAGEPEITAQMVRDADYFLKRGYVRPRPAKWVVGLEILSYGAAVVAGIGGSTLGDAWGVVTFLVAFVVGVVSLATIRSQR